jgi:ubiquinone/menaquinone biosynthesis C-methylase UbiE
MSPATIVDRVEWERAEIGRSAIEALQTADRSLVADAANVARYLAPSLSTVYPLEYAFALLGDIEGRRVLDFGCGSGENSLVLARRGAVVTGVDISESLVAIARKRLQLNGCDHSATFVLGSAHDLPLQDASVDVVLGIAILHHLDLDASSREVHRVLKPGGRAIFKEPVRDSRVIKAVRSAIPYRAPDVSPFERPLTSRELARFAHPFTRYRFRAFSLPFVNLTQAVRPLQRHIHRAYRLDSALLRRVPALAPFGGIRVIELVK